MSKYLVINEEYGYRYWVAEIEETQINEIKTWWLKLKTVLGMFFIMSGAQNVLTISDQNISLEEFRY